MQKHIVCQSYNGILEIQLARRDKKNALTNQMYADIQTAMENAITDNAIKVILLTSQGDFFYRRQ